MTMPQGIRVGDANLRVDWCVDRYHLVRKVPTCCYLRLGKRLQHIAQAVGEVADSMRSTLTADGTQPQFGVKVAGEAGIWFFSKATGEGSIFVTLIWTKPPPP
jgi:Trypsin-co-occurring domain 1